MSAALRVGPHRALNMYPLYHDLERAADPALAFTDGVPTALNAALLDGRLDVSAVSSIAFARNADRLRAAARRVDHRRRGGRLDPGLLARAVRARCATVAVTPHSATSVALLRVLARRRGRAFVPLDRPAAGGPGRRSTAVLLIADEALAGLRAAVRPRTAPTSGPCGASAPAADGLRACGRRGPRRSRASAATSSRASPTS